MNADLPVWIIRSYLALLGIGLGLGMQILVLIVQNTFPNSQVGMATAANNYFRQIGASIGTAVVGSLFVTNLGNLLAQRLPTAGAGAPGGANSFTPDLARELPDAVRHIIVGAYSDALTPVFLYMAPIVIAAAIVLVFLTEKPLATSIERDGRQGQEPKSRSGTDIEETPSVVAAASGARRGAGGASDEGRGPTTDDHAPRRPAPRHRAEPSEGKPTPAP